MHHSQKTLSNKCYNNATIINATRLNFVTPPIKLVEKDIKLVK